MAFVPSLGDACPLVGTRQGYGDVVCSTRRSRHRLTRSPASRIRMGSEAASAGTDAATTSAAIEYGGIQHVGVLVKDTEKSKKFYMEVLGMGDDHALRNPKLPFGGTFLRAGSSQVHLMELPIIDPTTGRPKHGGRDRHAAITVRSLAPLLESLKRHDWTYTMSSSGRRAIFLRDLDANALEFVEDPSV